MSNFIPAICAHLSVESAVDSAIPATNYKVRATASLTGSIVRQIDARKIGRDVSVVEVIGIVVLPG